jgi:uncharacterized protein YukE
MSGYRVDLTEMQLLIDQAAKLEESIEERLIAIQNRVEGLHINWTGRAAAAHKDFVDHWLRDSELMRADLNTLHKAITRVSGHYTSNVQTTSGMWPKRAS